MSLSCTKLETILCDYLDGTLSKSDAQQLERHLEGCPSCAQLANDAKAAVSFLERVEALEPPSELITKILYRLPAGEEPVPIAPAEHKTGIVAWIRRLFEPVLQPRFVMGMAMTILSFSMVGRVAGIPQKPVEAADLDPVKIWWSIDSKLHRTWNHAVKYYENLRLVYEIEHRLREWSAQEEQLRQDEERKSRAAEPVVPSSSGSQSPDRRNTR